MANETRTESRVFVFRGPGPLDLTKRLKVESEYSVEAMELKAERLSEAVAEAKSKGTPLPKEYHRDAYEVGIWMADPNATPEELARTMYKSPEPSVQERLGSFLRTDYGAKFLDIEIEERQRMITEISTGFN